MANRTRRDLRKRRPLGESMPQRLLAPAGGYRLADSARRPGFTRLARAIGGRASASVIVTFTDGDQGKVVGVEDMLTDHLVKPVGQASQPLHPLIR